jgi:Transglutaminase-like superfamily
MMSKIWRLRRLSAQQFWIVLQAFILLIFVRYTLRILKFKQVSQILRLNSTSSRSETSPDELSQAEEIAYLVNRVANHAPFHNNCLVRSLALRRILQSSHIVSELHIGVRKSGENSQQLEAHAWVEHKGIPLSDSSDIERIFHRIYADKLEQGQSQ